MTPIGNGFHAVFHTLKIIPSPPRHSQCTWWTRISWSSLAVSSKTAAGFSPAQEKRITCTAFQFWKLQFCPGLLPSEKITAYQMTARIVHLQQRPVLKNSRIRSGERTEIQAHWDNQFLLIYMSFFSHSSSKFNITTSPRIDINSLNIHQVIGNSKPKSF